MNNRISFRCPSCSAQLRAPIQLAGRSRPCPGCAETVMVPLRIPSEEPSILVIDDDSRGADKRIA